MANIQWEPLTLFFATKMLALRVLHDLRGKLKNKNYRRLTSFLDLIVLLKICLGKHLCYNRSIINTNRENNL